MITLSRFFILLSLLLAGLAAGCKGEAPAPAPAPTPAVTTVTLTAEPVTLTRQLPGRTRSFLIAEVRPQVTGIIEEQLFSEGGMVEAGEALYQLDDALYRAEYNRAKAALERSRATLEQARLNADRAAGLFEVNAVSKQEYENAMAALRQAEAEAGVAEAEVASSKVLLDYSRIESPISGRVGKSSVTKGALVTDNQADPLVTVQQLDPIYVDLTQSSREWLQLRKDLEAGNLQPTDELPVTIYLENGSLYEHEGKVAFSEVAVDPSTGSFSVRVVVPNPDHLLLPGMYVRAEVAAGLRRSAVLVPQQGVARGPKGDTTAMVVAEDGTVEQRVVQVSRTVGNHWLVESGLAAGDEVIVEGLQKIQPGMKVAVTETGLEGAAETAASQL